MSSQLNVNTIVDKAGSGGTNVKIANTSVTVAEGGSGTTNTVQGLAKSWVTHDASASTDDSFNTSSVTDSGTGHYGLNFTSNMANAHYIGSGSNLGSSSSFATAMTSDGAVPTTGRMDYHFRNFGTANATDQAFNRTMTHGDLA